MFNPPVTFIAALRSIVTYVAIALYVLLVGAPMVAVTLVTKKPGPLYAVGLLGVRIGLALSGIRWRSAGREHIQRDRAAVAGAGAGAFVAGLLGVGSHRGLPSGNAGPGQRASAARGLGKTFCWRARV